MNHCSRCGSFAINHSSHGRDGSDGHLCDVCYWRTRLEAAEKSLIECRSSVKSDMQSYKQLLLCTSRYDSLLNKEIDRLCALLGTIDDIITKEPNGK